MCVLLSWLVVRESVQFSGTPKKSKNALYYVVVIILFFSVSCCCVLFFNVFASGGRGLPVDFTLQRYMFFSIRQRKKATQPAGLTFGGRIMVGCRVANGAPKAGNSCCSTTCLMMAFMSRVSDTHFLSSPSSPHCENSPLSCVGLLALCASCLSEASGKPPESPPLLILSRVSDTHFSSSPPSPHCESFPLSCVGLLALCASCLSEASAGA